MSEILTHKESARVILGIFRPKRPGEMMRLSHLNMAFLEGVRSASDYKAGRDYAVGEGWINIRDGKVFLTDKGFEETE
jgi:hypothetical protein